MITKIGSKMLVKEAFGPLAGLATKFMPKLTSWGKSALGFGQKVGGGIVEGIKGGANMTLQGINGAQSAVRNAGNVGLWGKTKAGFTGMKNSMNNVYNGLGRGAKTTLGVGGALGMMSLGSGESDTPTINYNFYQPQNQQYSGSWQ